MPSPQLETLPRAGRPVATASRPTPPHATVSRKPAASAHAPTPAPQEPVLETIAGIGPATARRLRQGFGSEGDALAALRRGDVAAIQRRGGLAAGRARALVQAMQGAVDPHVLAATPAARRVLGNLLDRLASYAATPQGRARLRWRPPAATPAEAVHEARRVLAAARDVAGLDREQVGRALGAVKAIDDSPVRAGARLVVAGDDDVLDALRTLGVHRWCVLRGPEALVEADPHEALVVVPGDQIIPDADNVVLVRRGAGLADIVPESQLAWATASRATLEALDQLSRLVGLPGGRPSAAREALAALSVAPQAGPSSFRRELAKVEAEAQAALAARLAAVELRGDELMAALGRRLPARLQAILDDVLAAARGSLKERTGWDVQPFAMRLPLEVDDEEVERLVGVHQARAAVDAFGRQQAAARTLARLRPALDDEVRHWIERDAGLALGWFALDHGLSEPRLADGFSFEASVHLDLAGRGTAQRIGYTLGLGGPRVALLTGANSGGKSTLLEHLAQLALMARLGLPVVGTHVVVPWIDEVHLVTGRRGLDAGAFESFLRSFLPVVEGPAAARRLVLVDEVEAVTELATAARILAFAAERLVEAGSLAVIVTHLAQHVVDALDRGPVDTGPQRASDVAAGPDGSTSRAPRRRGLDGNAPGSFALEARGLRVDGIAASGLDEADRLVVDRQPRLGHHARSTPELIVARLAKRGGRHAGLFQALLEALGKGHK